MQILSRFWSWYERNLKLNTTVVAILFLWQLIHLYWLTADVVAHRLSGIIYFDPSPTLQFLIIIADYLEIPALISGSLLYISYLKKRFGQKNLWFLLLINSQWFHLFWLTDEFIIKGFSGIQIGLPIWLAWLAIFIDYLELPVILETVKNSLGFLRKG